MNSYYNNSALKPVGLTTFILMKLRELKDKFYRRILRKRLKNFNSFGSHIPILIGLGIFIKPKNVLELGAGLSSTPVFLNKSCYPDLKRFTSVENDLKVVR